MLTALRAILRTRRTLIWAAILVAAGAVLAFLPLFGVLGFELAFVVALLVSFAAADLGAAVVRREPALPVPAAWATGAAAALVLLVGPLLVITLNGLRVHVCDYSEGLADYVLLPGFSCLFGSAAGVTAQTFLRGRLGAVAAWLIVVGSIVLGVYRFYDAPPIFAYDPFAGYFPGTLYDENIRLGTPFLAARGEQAGFALAALACAAALRARGRRRAGALVLAGFALAGGIVLRVRAADLGFVVTADDLRARMAHIETEHFSVNYTRGAAFADQMPAIAREHEFRLAQVEAFFGVRASRRITSFYFASPAEKARWMGAENTYIAKPWRHEIYLSHEDFPHGAMRHEIAHVVAGEFGDPLFHVSVAWLGWPPARFNVGLIEGAAVAADWPTTARLSPHEAARAMLELELLPPLRTILAPGFFEFSSAQSYTTAGSFCHFLVERHGADAFRALYRSGGDFQAAYGQPLAALEAEWRDFLRTITLPPGEVEVARERFRRPGIFSRPCPHVVAALEAAAQERLADGEPERAVDIFRQICSTDPGEPARRLALAQALERAHQVGEAESLYRDLGADAEISTPLRARALLRLVDLLGQEARLADAAAPLAAALALPVDEATRRNLVIRRDALGDDPAAAPLRRYLFGRAPGSTDLDPLVLLERAHAITDAAPRSGLGPYLAGRMLHGRAAFADAAAELADGARLGFAEPEVARENDRLLASAAWLSGNVELCRAAATRLVADPDETARHQGQDWLARVAFGPK